ncbi:MAG: arsenate reductase (glutaredoxin) [Proteobacteria bacterium]|nr:arsenate reductase (glutaredoxin) [Pseudomonadota bacterium]
MPVTIFHNPRCGTSRDVLALIRATGTEPVIVDYLREPPPRAVWEALARRVGGGARALLRQKEPRYAELGLDALHWTEAELIDALVANPVLLNRPVVVTDRGACVCRPAELVRAIL